jgi:tripartite-type tricarboxylate transporter receptor subunit TctC
MNSWKIVYGGVFFIFFSCFASQSAFAQQPYYQNKTIKIIRGGEPGGSGDLQARALIPFLKKYIPGDPTIIVENMPGAAGRKAVNYIYSTAKPDGLAIGAVGAGLVAGPILGLPGSQYDIDIDLSRLDRERRSLCFC